MKAVGLQLQPPSFCRIRGPPGSVCVHMHVCACVCARVCVSVWVLSNCLHQLDVVLIICNFLKHRLGFEIMTCMVSLSKELDKHYIS